MYIRDLLWLGLWVPDIFSLRFSLANLKSRCGTLEVFSLGNIFPTPKILLILLGRHFWVVSTWPALCLSLSTCGLLGLLTHRQRVNCSDRISAESSFDQMFVDEIFFFFISYNTSSNARWEYLGKTLTTCHRGMHASQQKSGLPSLLNVSR